MASAFQRHDFARFYLHGDLHELDWFDESVRVCALGSQIFFEAASALQIRSCKPEHQRAALSTLEMFAAHFLPGE